MKSHKYKKFITEFEEWVQTKKWRKELKKKQLSALQEDITPFAGNFLKNYTNELLAYGSTIMTELEDKQAHKLRIKLKKLRYATDLFAPYLQKEHTPRKKLKALQDTLGKLHDMYVVKELHKLFLQSQTDEELFAYTQKIEADNEKRKKELQEAFFREWKDFKEIAQSVD